MSVDVYLYASMLLNDKRMPLVLLLKSRVDEWDVLILLGCHWLCIFLILGYEPTMFPSRGTHMLT